MIDTTAALTQATTIAVLGDQVQARFLRVGDIIERHHGHLFEIRTAPIVGANGRLFYSAANEQGGIVPIEIHPDAMVSLATVVN